MRKLTLKELEELNQINNNEIYRLRRIITQQEKDLASKDKLISGLAKKVNQLEKEKVLTEIFNNDPLNILNIINNMKTKQIEKRLEQYTNAYQKYLKTLETEELKNWVESKSNYTINSSDDREILIDDILYDEVLKMGYAISDYKLTDKQVQDKILELVNQTTTNMKNKKKQNRDRTNKGEKVFQMKGTFDEVWKEYMKLNEQLKNN